MTSHLTWYVARGSGIVTWGLLVASMVWGLLYATRVMRRRVSLWWLLGVHRFLGVLAIAFTGVHVAALVLDRYIDFSIKDVLVPFTSSWHPVATAWGIIAMYLLIAVEGTSLLKARLPHRWWRTIHLGSYLLFALATVHALSAGTDSRAVIGDGLAISIGAIAIAAPSSASTAAQSPTPTGRFPHPALPTSPPDSSHPHFWRPEVLRVRA